MRAACSRCGGRLSSPADKRLGDKGVGQHGIGRQQQARLAVQSGTATAGQRPRSPVTPQTAEMPRARQAPSARAASACSTPRQRGQQPAPAPKSAGCSTAPARVSASSTAAQVGPDLHHSARQTMASNGQRANHKQHRQRRQQGQPLAPCRWGGAARTWVRTRPGAARRFSTAA